MRSSRRGRRERAGNRVDRKMGARPIWMEKKNRADGVLTSRRQGRGFIAAPEAHADGRDSRGRRSQRFDEDTEVNYHG